MRRGHARRTHLEQPHADAASCELPSRFTAGQASSDDVDQLSIQSECSLSYFSIRVLSNE
jgi:hypothetical protein